ncbi:hypothetical protein VO54_01466 [Elizabethkingia miricola]|nr:hypothetical protein VO54_01466 [Elizabethkingia miricola]
MKKENQKQSQKKLSLRKIKVIKVSGLRSIVGGEQTSGGGDDATLTTDKLQGTSIFN